MIEIEQAIRDFIAEEILSGRAESSLDEEYPLLEQGIIDSIDLQRLVMFLENRFDVTVDEDLLVPENFETIRAIAEMIARLRAPT